MGSRFGALAGVVSAALQPVYFAHVRADGAASARSARPLAAAAQLLLSPAPELAGVRAQLAQLSDVLLDLRLCFLLLHERELVADRGVAAKSTGDLFTPLRSVFDASAAADASLKGSEDAGEGAARPVSTLVVPARSGGGYAPVHSILRHNLSLHPVAWAALEEEAKFVARAVFLVRTRGLLSRSHDPREFARRLKDGASDDFADPSGDIVRDLPDATSKRLAVVSATNPGDKSPLEVAARFAASFSALPGTALLPRMFAEYLGSARNLLDDGDLISLDLDGASVSSRRRVQDRRAALRVLLASRAAEVKGICALLRAEADAFSGLSPPVPSAAKPQRLSRGANKAQAAARVVGPESAADVLVLQIVAAFVGDPALIGAAARAALLRSAEAARALSGNVLQAVGSSAKGVATGDLNQTLVSALQKLATASAQPHSSVRRRREALVSAVSKAAAEVAVSAVAAGSNAADLAAAAERAAKDAACHAPQAAPGRALLGSNQALAVYSSGSWTAALEAAIGPGKMLRAIASPGVIGAENSAVATPGAGKLGAAMAQLSSLSLPAALVAAAQDVAGFRDALQIAVGALRASSGPTAQELPSATASAKSGGLFPVELVPRDKAVASIRELPALSGWESKGHSALWRVLKQLVRTPSQAAAVLRVAECAGLVHDGFAPTDVLAYPPPLLMRRFVHDAGPSKSASRLLQVHLPLHRAASPLADPRFNALLDELMGLLRTDGSTEPLQMQPAAAASLPTVYYLFAQWIHLLRPAEVHKFFKDLLPASTKTSAGQAQIEPPQPPQPPLTQSWASFASSSRALSLEMARQPPAAPDVGDSALRDLELILEPVRAICRLPRALEPFERDMPGVRGLVFSFALRLCMLLSDAQLVSVRRTVGAACRVLELRRRLLPAGSTPYTVRYPSGASFAAGARVTDESIAPLWASVSHAHANFGPLAFVLTRPFVHLLVNGWLTPAFITLARAVVVRGAVLSGAILREGEQAAISAFEHEADAAIEARELTSEALVDAELERRWADAADTTSVPAKAAVQIVTERALAILRRRGEPRTAPLTTSPSNDGESPGSSPVLAPEIVHASRSDFARALLRPKLAEIARLIDARSLQLARGELLRDLSSSGTSADDSNAQPDTSVLESIIRFDGAAAPIQSTALALPIASADGAGAPVPPKLDLPRAAAADAAAAEEADERGTFYSHVSAPLHFTVRRVAPRAVAAEEHSWELRNDEESIACKVCVMGLPILGQKSQDRSASASPDALATVAGPVLGSEYASRATEAAASARAGSVGVTEALRGYLQSMGECTPFTESRLAGAASQFGEVEHVELCWPPARLYEEEFWAAEKAQFSRWLWYKGRKQPPASSKDGSQAQLTALSGGFESEAFGVKNAPAPSFEDDGDGEFSSEAGFDDYMFASSEELAGSWPDADDADEELALYGDLSEGKGSGRLDPGAAASLMPPSSLSTASGRVGSAFGSAGSRAYSTASLRTSDAGCVRVFSTASAGVTNSADAGDDESDGSDRDGFSESDGDRVGDGSSSDEGGAGDNDAGNPLSAERSPVVAASPFPPRSRAASFPDSNNMRSLVAMRFAQKPLLAQMLRRLRSFNADSQLLGFVSFASRGAAQAAVSRHLRYFGLVVDSHACAVVPASEMRTLLVRRVPAGLTTDAVAVLVNLALRSAGLEASASAMRYRHNVVVDGGGHVLLTFESHAEAVRGLHALQGRRWRDYGNNRGRGLVVGWAAPEAYSVLAKAAQSPYNSVML